VDGTLGAASVPTNPEELEDGSSNLHPDGVTPDEVLAFQEAQDTYRAAIRKLPPSRNPCAPWPHSWTSCAPAASRA
jgi:hypothetical protein